MQNPNISETGAARRPLRRIEASAYLFSQYGIQRAPATLAKLAVVGGGPLYHKANRTPLYRPEDLDAWAKSLITAPKASTSN